MHAQAKGTVLDQLAIRRRDRFFFSGFAVAALFWVFAGFAPTYYLRGFTGAADLPLVVHLHAALFSAWTALFVVQTSLIAAGRTNLHRQLGVLGTALGVAMLVFGYATAIAGARRGWTGPNNPRDSVAAVGFLAVPFRDLLQFGGFFGAAIYSRRQPEKHKRLMVLAMFNGVLPAAGGRLPLPWAPPVWLCLLVAGPVYDRLVHGRVNKVYWWGIGINAVAIATSGFVFTRQPAVWRTVAGWLIR